MYFSPTQLGVGTHVGSEAAVHATRHFIAVLPDGYVVPKLDFCNAFNSVRRDLLLGSVHWTAPGIYRFCHISFSNPSIQKFDNRTINTPVLWGSTSGGSTGLSLSYSVSLPWLLRLQSELVAGLMDDLTLGGPCIWLTAGWHWLHEQHNHITFKVLS